MSTEVGSVVSAFFPRDESKQIFESEPSMITIAQVIIKTMVTGCDAFIKGRMTLLDPNPGDDGCQMRAILLREFCLSENLIEESLKLVKSGNEIGALVNKRRSCSARSAIGSLTREQFFAQTVGSIAISQEMAFLLQCRLLNVVRKPFKQLDNGIVLTRTEIGAVSTFAKGFGKLDGEFRRRFGGEMQANFSGSSIAFLRKEAEKIFSLPEEEKNLIARMLSPESVKKGDVAPEFAPKSFACLFYQVKAIMIRLRELQATVTIKSIVPKGQRPFHILLAPTAVGEEFAPLSIEEDALHKENPLFVIEGVVNPSLTKEELTQIIEERGLTCVILACTAQESQFGSSPHSVEDVEAIEEITHFQEVAQILGCEKEKNPLILVDHMFCNTAGEELR